MESATKFVPYDPAIADPETQQTYAAREPPSPELDGGSNDELKSIQSTISGGNLTKGGNADRRIVRESNSYFARYTTTT
jgi:hypothetical protein